MENDVSAMPNTVLVQREQDKPERVVREVLPLDYALNVAILQKKKHRQVREMSQGREESCAFQYFLLIDQ